LRQINNFKKEAKDREDRLKNELSSAKSEIDIKDNIEAGLKYKLERTKEDSDNEVNRLKGLMEQLRKELLEEKQFKDTKVIEHRTQLVSETESRIKHVRNLASTIE
jgi:hypothetical protein